MKMNKIFNLLALGVCIATLTGCTSTSNNTQDYISEDQAKAIALEHAGVSESEVSFVLSKFDLDDGIAEYEVEFYSDSTEFDYEIDAISGEVRSYDFDMENKPTTTPSQQDTAINQDYISEDQAKSIAFTAASINEKDAEYVKCEFDYDDGRAEYDIEWNIGRTEYEYTIDAIDGSIREYDIEQDD